MKLCFASEGSVGDTESQEDQWPWEWSRLGGHTGPLGRVHESRPQWTRAAAEGGRALLCTFHCKAHFQARVSGDTASSGHLSCAGFPEEADLHGYEAPLAFITIAVSGYHYHSLADTWSKSCGPLSGTSMEWNSWKRIPFPIVRTDQWRKYANAISLCILK